MTSRLERRNLDKKIFVIQTFKSVLFGSLGNCKKKLAHTTLSKNR